MNPTTYSHAAFHHAIANSGQATTASLVYADWLDENGQPEAAEVIRRHTAGGEGAESPLRHSGYIPNTTFNPIMEPGQFGATVGVSNRGNSLTLDLRRADAPGRMFTYRTGLMEDADMVRLLSGLHATGAAIHPQSRGLLPLPARGEVGGVAVADPNTTDEFGGPV